MYDEDGNKINNRTMLGVYLDHLEADGEINKATVSDVLLHDCPMISFVIDDNIFNQMDNILCVFIEGKYQLVMRDGIAFKTIEDQETPKQHKIRELKEELAILESSGN